MAIDKKLIHFKKWNTFISSEGVNGNYTTPSTIATSTSPALYGQIKETSIVFIQDVQKIWTHGKLYDCSTPDLSAYLTAEDLATLNAFMNNSSVSKDGETLTVKINNSTQSLTNTWRSISDKTNGTSSTISASEKAVKAVYDLAASKTSNTGTVTSVTPGTGLTGASSDAAITTSGTINLKTAGTSEIGGIKVATVGTAASGANTTVNANKFAVHVDSDGLGYVAIPAYTNNSGDITGVTAGSGLTGGATSGNATLNVGAGTGITVAADSVSVNLKDATALTVDATAATTTSGRVYPVAVDKSGYLAVNVPWKNDDTKSFTITATAKDDDVVVLSGTNGTNKVTYTASHAKTFGNTTAPYTAKYTSGNSTTSISGYGSSATIKIPQITVDEYGHVRAGADESVTITMPSAQTIPTLSGGASAETGKYVSGVTVSGHTVTVKKGTLPTIPTTLKNPNSLTFGNKSYDGSSAQTITAADLGLDSALKFHGTSKTAITDGSTTQTVTLSNDAQHTAENGCVLFYGNKEFVWNGSSWEELGNEGNYKVKQTAVSSPSANGSTTAFINTISQNTNGVITVTKKNLAAATTSVIGGLKLYNAAKTTAISPNSATTTDGRYYAVELDKDGKAFVNVPWTDTDTNTDTSTTYNGHYTPTGSAKTGTASGSTLGFGGAVVTGLTYDGKGHVTGFSTSKLPSNPNTDASCTETGHYTPATESTTNKQSAGSGKYISGIKLDSKKHVVGIDTRTLPSFTESYKGTITKVQANGTDVSSSGTANIPAASTSAYGVTKLSSATNSTSTTLAATASAVKAAYDLANGKWTYNADTIKAVKVNNAAAADSASAVAWSGITSKPTTVSGYGITDAYTKSAANGKFITGDRDAYNVNSLYNAGIHMVASGTNVPCGSNYGVCLTLPYRQLYSNSKPDFGAQIFLPNGDDNTKPNSLFFRTSLGDTWNAWQEVATKGSLATVATSGSYNDLTNKPTIPSAVTSSTVSGWGFTKNAGTITGIKMNGASKGTSGVVDLGTVITSLDGYATQSWVEGKGYKTTDNDTKNTAGSSNKTGSKLLLVGATSTTTGTTYTNSNCYVGKDNCLYSGGTKVLTSHQDISGKAPNNHASTATTYGVATSGTSAKYGHVKLVSGNVNGQKYADGVAAAAAHSHSNYLTSHQDISGKQDKLVSGENIKTINGTSILGKGDIEISGYDDTEIKANLEQAGKLAYEAAMRSSRNEQNKVDKSSLSTVATSGSYNDLTNKPTIPSAVTSSTVSGWGFTKNSGTVTGVKINGSTKSPSSGIVDLGTVITSHQDISGKQDKLTSGTNIKTINGQSILGSGDITISGGGVSEDYVNTAIANAITTTLNTAV